MRLHSVKKVCGSLENSPLLFKRVLSLKIGSMFVRRIFELYDIVYIYYESIRTLIVEDLYEYNNTFWSFISIATMWYECHDYTGKCILVKIIWKCIHKLRRTYRKYTFDKKIVIRKMVLLSVETYWYNGSLTV